MFTGIVDTVGRTAAVSGSCLEIESTLDDLMEGESVAVNGVCLTVRSANSGRFESDISEETLRRTALGALQPGHPVNLERALRPTDRLGGHFVQGHVDAKSQITGIEALPASIRMRIACPTQVAKYLVEKGSIAVDGVSLTVSQLAGDEFVLDLVPHTLERTTLGRKKAGDWVNLEVDILAKYIERSMADRRPGKEESK